jgi:hypothetical protein
MWWNDRAIEATVARQFVLSQLLPDEQAQLNEPLGFGKGLTDDTYMDWIDQKAKKIFLILVDLRVPDQIFGMIDDSWDDADLPIPLERVRWLRLTPERDKKFERKFYQRQFAYLLKHLHYGDFINYDHDDVVPIELVERRVPLLAPPGSARQLAQTVLGLGPG